MVGMSHPHSACYVACLLLAVVSARWLGLTAPNEPGTEQHRQATVSINTKEPALSDVPSRPLSGIRVVELGRLVAAPLAAQILGDLGADVVKVEHPRGDEYRRYGPSFLAEPDGEPSQLSSGFISNNRNKQSVAVDFSTPEGQDIIRQLAGRADVFIENFKVGGLRKYGLDEAALRARHPGLIYLSVTGYGQTGPYSSRPATDGAIQAMSGMQSLTGEPDGPPQRAGTLIVDVITGIYSALAIVAALRQRDSTEAGQHIDMSLLDCAMASLATSVAEYRLSGEAPIRHGNTQPGSVPARSFVCRDGHVQIQAAFDAHFVRLCACFGYPELAGDRRFATRAARVEHEAELSAILEPEFASRSVDEVFRLLAPADIICSPVNSVAAALADPQVIAREVEQDFALPDGRTVPNVASPLRMSGTSISYDRPAPTIGHHTSEVLASWLNTTPEQIAAWRRRGVVA